MESTPSGRPLRALLREFDARFGGTDGARACFAPGRVNLLGAHLDYSGGLVLPAAIERGTTVVGRLRGDRRLRLASLDRGPIVEVDARDLRPDPAHEWANYPKGVVHVLREERGDFPGADLLVSGNLPIGGGLSSSASVLLATAFLLDRLAGAGSTLEALVDVVWRAEREFVGVRCGIMDPFAAAFGRAGRVLFLDCKVRRFELLPFDADALAIVILDAGRRRALAGSGFNDRVEECARALGKLRQRRGSVECLRDADAGLLDEARPFLTEGEARRVRHVIEETARVREGAAAIRAGDAARFGALLDASHASTRDLYEVSSPECDALADAAREAGALGARLSGGGFGGCVLALVPRRDLARFEERLLARAARPGGASPVAYALSPSDGVREVTDGAGGPAE